MIYTSKVITKDRLKDILFWDRLSGYNLDIDCEYIGCEYDFSEYQWQGDETIVSKCYAYIDDYTAEWVQPNLKKDFCVKAKSDMILVSVATNAHKHDDYFYMSENEYNSLTDVEHQNTMVSNDLFNTYLEFYKAHAHEYDGCGNIEDWDKSVPLDIFHKHIDRHANAKFRGQTDLHHMLHWLSDRWEMYESDFEKHRYTSTASEQQEFMFDKFFQVIKIPPT